MRRTQGPTLILSPHPDDAAFCLGGALLGGALPGPVAIVTVFGQTNYLGIEQRFVSDIALASSIRRKEDEAFAAQLDTPLHALMYPEAALRYGASSRVIFDLEHERESLAPPGLEQELRALITRLDAKWLLAPLALGGHRDHRIVCELGETLAASLGIGVAFYEDLPYAAQVDRDAGESRAATLCPEHRAMLIHLDDHLATKLRMIRCYETQIHVRTLNELEAHARSLDARGAERIWVPPAWT